MFFSVMCTTCTAFCGYLQTYSFTLYVIQPFNNLFPNQVNDVTHF